MRILLVAPPVTTSLSATLPNKYTSLDIGCYPFLGLMCLASYLDHFSRHRVEILDMIAEKMPHEVICAYIAERKPDIVGIYASSTNISSVHRIATLVRSSFPHIIIVIGGPHCDLYGVETISWDAVDYVISGEGQETLMELMDVLERGGALTSIRGMYFKKDNTPVFTGERPLIENLDLIPFPLRENTPYRKYHSVIGKDTISTTIMASQGCPYSCNFCSSKYGGTYRMRSVRNVVEELRECVRLGIREFFFFDEIFTAHKKRTIEICDAIVRDELDIVFNVRSRVNTVDEETLAALKRAGCACIQYGVESASERILDLMNKKITPSQVREAVRATRKAGIDVFLDFMIGYPSETVEEIRNTISFAEELNPDFIQFSITELAPGTKIYAEAMERGFVNDFWREAALHPPALLVPPLASETISRAELEDIFRKAYLGFYFRPSYIMRRFRKISSLSQFRRQAKAAFNLLWGR